MPYKAMKQSNGHWVVVNTETEEVKDDHGDDEAKAKRQVKILEMLESEDE